MLAAYDRLTAWIDTALAPALMPSLARLVFAGTLLMYYWNSGLTKLGEGLFSPALGAYTQILPRAFEAAGYDASQIGIIGRLVVLAGTWAEFALPILILLGLFTRLAALGMIGFVFVQSWVDIFGHGIAAEDIGAWFDRFPDALIVDQRAFWVMVLLILVARGAGPLSADFLLARRRRTA